MAVPVAETDCLPQLIRSLKFAVIVTVRDLEGDEEVLHELMVGRDSSTIGAISAAAPIVNVRITCVDASTKYTFPFESIAKSWSYRPAPNAIPEITREQTPAPTVPQSEEALMSVRLCLRSRP